MSLTLGDNFSYGGSKPLDARLKYATLADMKAVVDATMYDGCLAYCVATDKTYQWKSTNTVDADTGRWREFENELPVATASVLGGVKVGNGLQINDGVLSVIPLGVGGGGYAPIGTIISYMGTTAPQDYLACDGTTYNIADYQQLATFFATQFGSSNFFGGDGVTTFKVPDLRGEFLRGTGTNSHENQGNGANVGGHQDATEFLRIAGSATAFAMSNIANDKGAQKVDSSVRDSDASGKGRNVTWSGSWDDTVSSRYTSRPTNTSILWCIKAIDAGEVYSTTERRVGTWIDGKPLYQKTFTVELRTTEYTVTASKIASISVSNIDKLFVINGFHVLQSGSCMPIPWMADTLYGTSNQGRHLQVIYSNVDSEIAIYCNQTNLSATAYITAQYTKTTD